MRTTLKSLFRIIVIAAAALCGILFISWITIARPTLPQPPTQAITPSDELSARLKTHVRVLSEEILNRSYNHPDQLDKAASYIRNQWESMGLIVEDQTYELQNQTYRNVITRIPSSATTNKGKIILGAHYDSAHNLPGADDNASGTAGLIELARILKDENLDQDIELVAYTLEEPPNFGTQNMGSYIHAKSLKQANSNIDLMISIEMIGYYSDEPGSQEFPIPTLKLFYPDAGNFIGIVDRLKSRHATKIKRSMRRATDLPVHSINAPATIPGINFSDHLNYWHFGYNAVMITDTSFYRNKTYHTPEDTADKLNYVNMSKVVNAIAYYITQ